MSGEPHRMFYPVFDQRYVDLWKLKTDKAQEQERRGKDDGVSNATPDEPGSAGTSPPSMPPHV